MSFVEVDDGQENGKDNGKLSILGINRNSFKNTVVCLYNILIHVCIFHEGEILRSYMVHFSLELICEPAAPVRVIDVQCPSQVSSDNLTCMQVDLLNI